MTNPEAAKKLFFAGLACLERGEFANAEQLFVDTLVVLPRSVPTLSNLAISQYQQKKFPETIATAKRIIEIDPANIDAHMILATSYKEQESYEEALEIFDKIITVAPPMAEPHCNRSIILNKLTKYREAIESANLALSIRPTFVEAFLNRGNSLRNLKRFDEALVDYDKALSIKPDVAEAWLGRGNVLADLKRPDEAFAAYDKALSIKPDLENAWIGRGNLLRELKRPDEAFAAYDKALSIKPDLENAWVARGNLLGELMRPDEAFAAYDKALSMKPDLENAWLGRGNVLRNLRLYDEALAAYDGALSIKPDLVEAWLGRGNVFSDLKRDHESLAAFDKALSIDPDVPEAWFDRGNFFAARNQHDKAFAAYDKAMSIKPDLADVESQRLHAKMLCCNWSNFQTECRHLIDSNRAGTRDVTPFVLLTIESSAEDQLAAADKWAQDIPATSVFAHRSPALQRHERIRVGYLSADLRNHPVSYLLASVFEKHDRRHFETIGLSLGPNDDSHLRVRLKRAFDNFSDLGNSTDREIFDAITALEIDILIDLMGHTRGAPLPVLTRRPVPIQVNYLGYPGTIGGTHIDYILADKTVVTPEDRKYYSEKVVYLPDSYMPHDAIGRRISGQPFKRADFGLPDHSVVFCCFNNAYKLNPGIFTSWMNILRAVGGSVLWLGGVSEIAQGNLRREAKAQGIDARRLIFAKRLDSSADHLARHRLADLFLDTLPYNAHTTASDALWAGLPVLTQFGETFAGRVAASLLHAIGMPELITHSREEYEALAIELARNHGRLRNIREKLERNRLAAPLFDTALYTRHLEIAYQTMYRRHHAGLPPDHIETQAIITPR
jgi:protein O-GlcNAc transferase